MAVTQIDTIQSWFEEGVTNIVSLIQPNTRFVVAPYTDDLANLKFGSNSAATRRFQVLLGSAASVRGPVHGRSWNGSQFEIVDYLRVDIRYDIPKDNSGLKLLHKMVTEDNQRLIFYLHPLNHNLPSGVVISDVTPTGTNSRTDITDGDKVIAMVHRVQFQYRTQLGLT